MQLRTILCATAAVAAFAVPSFAAEQGDFLIRFRAIGVLPNESASISPTGGDVDISDQVVPEFDFTYFFTDNIAAELIAAVAPHEVDALGTGLPGQVDLADVTLLPPVLTLQYHFDTGTNFRPYVGAGVNWTHFFDEDSPLGSIDFDDSFGLAGQAGFDYYVNDIWFLNFDVKYVDINTDVTINSATLGTITADVEIDPWIIGIGFGREF